MAKDKEENKNKSNFLIYTSQDGKVQVDVYFQEETVWLTQKKLSELFGVERSVITKHLRNIFEEKELDKNSVCAIFAHTAEDGKKYDTKYYNLDAIISVMPLPELGGILSEKGDNSVDRQQVGQKKGWRGINFLWYLEFDYGFFIWLCFCFCSF